MAKAEQVVPTGLSEKSRIYVVKKKEEELQSQLEAAQSEAQSLVSDARQEADRVLGEARGKAQDAEKMAFEQAAAGADGKVTEISSNRESLIEGVQNAAKSKKKSALDDAASYLLNE
jgi:vacuolar-type H+-ATPase subunit H